MCREKKIYKYGVNQQIKWELWKNTPSITASEYIFNRISASEYNNKGCE